VNCAREVEALRIFAESASLWLDPSSLGQFHRGRREHDLFGYSVEEWVFKITRGAGYGLVPMPLDGVSGMISDWLGVFPATPSQ
jgi:hypothetical protein